MSVSQRHPGAPAQLTLRMWLDEDFTFTNFIAGHNAEPVRAVREAQAGGERFVFLWGGAGSGRSHVLQAACQQVGAQGQAAVYLPLRQADEFAPAMLEGLEEMAVVALDDIDAIAGRREWEEALFHLYNRLRDRGEGVLLVAATQPPAALSLTLADLRSRLAWGLVFQLRPLDDVDKRQALQVRARSRGFDMPDEVADYLLRRCQRDLPALFALLDRLDRATLVRQRRLTVPFVREMLGEEKGHDV